MTSASCLYYVEILMSLFISILAAILAIVVIILIHELGHFTVAKCLGVKVLKFSIGFGKALWSHKGKDGTEYVLAVLPLGGYVKMLGEGDEPVSEEDIGRAYNRKPLLSRMAIVVAGPLTNFLLAACIFWVIFMMGVTHIKPIIGAVVPNSIAAKAGIQPRSELVKIDGKRTYNWQRVLIALVSRMGDKDQMVVKAKPPSAAFAKTYYLQLTNWSINQRSPELLKSLGMSPYQPKISPVIARVIKNSPAEKGGLKAGDRILRLNGRKINDWLTFVKAIQAYPDKQVNLTIRRNHQQRLLKLRTGARSIRGKQFGFLGVESQPPKWPPGMVQHIKYSVFSAWWPAISQVATLTAFNFLVLAKMLIGKISLLTLGGPITIFHTAGQASQMGLSVYLGRARRL